MSSLEIGSFQEIEGNTSKMDPLGTKDSSKREFIHTTIFVQDLLSSGRFVLFAETLFDR